jgi:hypothetical protein
MFYSRQLNGASEHFSPERGEYLSPGRRRCALARPSLESGKAESPGRDVGLAESGFQPWVSAMQECALKVARERRSVFGEI